MINYNKMAVEWTPVQNKDFSITVRSWKRESVVESEWHWNVYAHICETHPLFSDVDAAMDLPFHGGCTYEQYVTYDPAQGIRYEWQKQVKSLKVGCDYSHYGDNFGNDDPVNGVPFIIQKDIEHLALSLMAVVETSGAIDTEGGK